MESLKDLDWAALPNATGYTIYRAVGDTVTADTSTLYYGTATPGYVDDHTEPDTTYTYLVQAAVGDAQDIVEVGTATISTPEYDDPIAPKNIGAPAAGPGASVTPSNVTAIGVNDSSIFVQWTDNSKNAASFSILMAEAGTTNFEEVGTVPGDVTGYMVRLLPRHTSWVFEVVGHNHAFQSSDGVTNPSQPSAVASTVTPTKGDLIYIIGGLWQSEAELEGVQQGKHYGTPVGVGQIFKDLVARGYNVYLSAEADWGGVMTWNAHGIGWDEVEDELANGRTTNDDLITNVGLIGYSHGGGIAYNLAKRIRDDSNVSVGGARVVFSGMIDAVQRTSSFEYAGGDNASPLTESPSGSEIGFYGFTSNWYQQTNGFPVPVLYNVHGAPMTDIPQIGSEYGDNHLEQAEKDAQGNPTGKSNTHATMCEDLFVRKSLENDLYSEFYDS